MNRAFPRMRSRWAFFLLLALSAHLPFADALRAAEPQSSPSPFPSEVARSGGGEDGEVPGYVVIGSLAGGYLATYQAASGAVSRFFIASDVYQTATDPELPVRRPKRVLTLSSFGDTDPLAQVVEVDHVMRKVDEPNVKHVYYAFDGLGDLPKVLARAAAKGPYDLIEIHTHGYPGGIMLGDGTRITAKNVEKWKAAWASAPSMVKDEAGLRFHACLLAHVPSSASATGKRATAARGLLEELASPVLREGGTVVASQKVVSTLPGASTKWARRIAEATSGGMNTFMRIPEVMVVSGELGGWSNRPRGDFLSVDVKPSAGRECLKSALKSERGP